MSEYKHAEAFCHMRYTNLSDPEKHVWIWNSRDGVTPFIAFIPDAGEHMHKAWNLDRRDSQHQPKVGDLIWAGPADQPKLVMVTDDYLKGDQAQASVVDRMKVYREWKDRR